MAAVAGLDAELKDDSAGLKALDALLQEDGAGTDTDDVVDAAREVEGQVA